jgi:hypothetical protein
MERNPADGRVTQREDRDAPASCQPVAATAAVANNPEERPADPEPEAAGEEFGLWLDRQGYDNVELLFDGGHWNPKDGAKHPRVREWLKRNLQAQRLRDWLQENRYAQRSREARPTRIVSITRLMQITIIVSAVVASAWIIWHFLHRP